MEKKGVKTIVGNEKFKISIEIIIISLFFLMYFYFVYISEPRGDDILGKFDGALSVYLDELDLEVGTRITSLNQVVGQLKTHYLYWSGRMPGYAIMFVGRLASRFVTSFVTAALAIGICILPLKIIYQNMRNALKHMLFFIIIWLAVFWYKPFLYYTYMWTMTSIYSSTVFFCLAYYALVFSYQEHKWNTHNKKVLLGGVQVLGLVAGWSHEVLSITMITVVGVKWLIDVRNKNVKWYGLFMHTGLGIGYLFGFFAPGNFHRMHESHDQTSLNVLMRIMNSIRMHIDILISPNRGMRCLFGIIVILTVFALVRLLVKKGIKEGIVLIIENNIQFVVGGIMSIIAWGLVNHVAPYGLDLWIIIVYILLFQTIKLGFEDISINIEWIQIICGLALALVVIVKNINEVVAYTAVSLERRSRISEALENNQEEVLVPLYPNTLPSYRYSLNALNNQERYDTEHYREYYGIHIILSNEE